MESCIGDQGRKESEALDGDRRRRESIDAYVGSRVRLRRKSLELSAKALAEALGVRYQQINFYETGRNRISAGSLHVIAETLDVPVNFFFDGMPDHLGIKKAVGSIRKTDDLESLNIFAVSDLKTVETEIRMIAALFYSVERPVLRKGILDLMRLLGREL